MTRTFRIRRCSGNRDCWLLVRLRDDGTESESYGSYVTAYSLDALLLRASYFQFVPQDRVELVL